MSGLSIVFSFLISLSFNLLFFAIWLRVILRFLRISPLNPTARQIYGLSDPLLLPFERIFYPKQTFPYYDWSSLVIIFILELIKFTLLSLVVYHALLPLIYLLLLTAADFTMQPLNLLFYAVLGRIILNFVNVGWQQHPLADLLIKITNPLLNLGYKIIPNISGFDFAPLIVLVILKIISLFITASIQSPLL